MLAKSRTVSENGRTRMVETNSMTPDERLQRRRHAGRPEQVAEVAEALVLEADADEDHPDEQREEQRDGHAGRGRHLEDRDDAGHVAEVDEDEQAEQERRPARPVLAHRLHDDLVLDELDDRSRRGCARPSARPSASRRAGEEEDARCRSAPPATAMSATLLNVGKRSCQRRISLIGGNSSANTCDPFLCSSSVASMGGRA